MNAVTIPVRLYSRILWLFVLCGHVLAAATWLAMMPGGFGVTHARFWSNRAIPVIVLLLLLASLVAARRGRTQIARGVLTLLVAIYISAAATCVVLYPISGRWPAVGMVAAAGVVALAMTQLPSGGRRAWGAVSAAVGLAIGITMTATQRAPMSSARPLPTTITTLLGDRTPAATAATSQPTQGVVRLLPGVVVHPGDGSIDLTSGRAIVSLHPLLTFTSRSPDRFWTCFASRRDRLGPPRRLISRNATGESVQLQYADDGVSSLDVNANVETVDLITQSTLPADVYSHLNTFAQMHVAGHQRLAISFSPCLDERIAFTPQDGAPARFAYVDADRAFHVVQASAGEKGPFRSIAQGHLPADEALVITLHDEGRDAPLARITLRDWAAQASTALSPTAGWGVPQNAIEFSLNGSSDRSTASLFITLAATSVGRGFDSVGHAAGTYVNRMRIELPASPAGPP